MSTGFPAVRPPILWFALGALLLATTLVSLGLGRYHVPVQNVVGILISNVVSVETFWSETDRRVVELIRVPRILIAILAGAGLSLSGASLQGIFRNPLVGPGIIGVSSGAAFGGSMGILLYENHIVTMAFAFVCGLVAMTLVYFISRIGRRSSILMLVLAGIIAGAFFTALISLIKYVADPYEKLPSIVMWLMGSFATATYTKLSIVALPVMAAGVLIYLMRFRVNVLSLGDEEAEALGIKVERSRWAILVLVTMITSAVVAIAGVIGWVGLVIPHIARMVVGPDHRLLLPASALIGAMYLLIVDDLARAATMAEIPLGIITAIIGAPVFAYLLRKTQAKGWKSD